MRSRFPPGTHTSSPRPGPDPLGSTPSPSPALAPSAILDLSAWCPEEAAPLYTLTHSQKYDLTQTPRDAHTQTHRQTDVSSQTHTRTTDLRRHTLSQSPLPAGNPTEFQHLKGLVGGLPEGISPLESPLLGNHKDPPLLPFPTSSPHSPMGAPQLFLAGPSVPRDSSPMLALCPGAALAVGVHLACPPPRGPEGAGIWGLGLRG